jgi:hypothetical protein
MRASTRRQAGCGGGTIEAASCAIASDDAAGERVGGRDADAAI